MVAKSNYYISHLRILRVMGNVEMDSNFSGEYPPNISDKAVQRRLSIQDATGTALPQWDCNL